MGDVPMMLPMAAKESSTEPPRPMEKKSLSRTGMLTTPLPAPPPLHGVLLPTMRSAPPTDAGGMCRAGGAGVSALSGP